MIRKERISKKTDYINNYIKCACMLSCSVMSNSLRLMDCTPPGSSIHGIFQARMLEWVAISYTRESSLLRYQTRVCCISCTGRWNLHHLHYLGSPTLSVNDPNAPRENQLMNIKTCPRVMSQKMAKQETPGINPSMKITIQLAKASKINYEETPESRQNTCVQRSA